MPEEKKKPAPKPKKLSDTLPCPKGHPLANWVTKTEGNKRAYLKAVYGNDSDYPTEEK